MTTKQKHFACLIGVLVMGSGCASTHHHRAECGSVDCGHCASGCTHHSQSGAQYLPERPVEAERAIDITRRPYDD